MSMEKKSVNLKQTIKTSILQISFVYEAYMIFSVDYDPTDKSDILNIFKYLMVKNNIK